MDIIHILEHHLQLIMLFACVYAYLTIHLVCLLQLGPLSGEEIVCINELLVTCAQTLQQKWGDYKL